MKPMAVACQRGTKGNFTPSSCMIYCHRMVRSGNTRVAVTTHPRNGKKLALPRCPTTSARCTSWSAHHRRIPEIRSPATAALPMGDLLAGLSEAKLDEVEDFFHQFLMVRRHPDLEFFLEGHRLSQCCSTGEAIFCDRSDFLV